MNLDSFRRKAGAGLLILLASFFAFGLTMVATAQDEAPADDPVAGTAEPSEAGQPAGDEPADDGEGEDDGGEGEANGEGESADDGEGETAEGNDEPATAEGGEGEDGPAAKENVDWALKLHPILVGKCGECHGTHLKKPEGRFGIIDDLRALAADEDQIIPGEPEESYSFETVIFPPDDPEFMPPEDSDIAPLTEEEIEIFRQWILTGAKVSDEAAALPNPFAEGIDASIRKGGKPKANGENGTAENGNGDDDGTAEADVEEDGPEFMERLEKFLGQFHSASTHLPIGLLIAAAISEFLCLWFSGPRLRFVTRFCLWFGALGAVYSLASGWWYAEHKGYAEIALSAYEFDRYGIPLFSSSEELRKLDIFWHRWLGVLTPILAFVLAILAVIVERACYYRDEYEEHKEKRRRGWLLWLFRLGVFVMLVLISVVGYLGGNLVYGAGHYEAF